METALDMDMASAACPSCKLIELQLPLLDGFYGDKAHLDAAMADFGTAVGTAAKLGTTAVSMSYGYPTDTDVEFGQNAPAHSCTAAEAALCFAGKGWDGPTGVGVPNGLAGF
ncbi:hypothetical protein [Kutzneria kofuensis]|uniref:Uncharacterized protein n=1 Tax=Kutzneria kofuensis TaxID=103725 RepID=A0A7W9KBS7_9PSEU|nr:hypothetical protein [Kutzneria kofuensis]MBB5889631.1 hypothetical protein [Kutzneria kofuensis]